MTSRTKKIVGFTIVAVVSVWFGAVCWRLRSAPAGAFHSYSIYPHDPSDRLVFSNGTVMMYTCCGDSPWGTYRQNADGTWIWSFPRKGNNAPPLDVVVHPGVFSITLEDMTAPGSSDTLRRRFFEKFPF